MKQKTLHISTVEEELDRIVYKIDKFIENGETDKIEQFREKLQRIVDALALLTEERWKANEKAYDLDKFKKKTYKYLDIIDGDMDDMGDMGDEIESVGNSTTGTNDSIKEDFDIAVDDITDEEIEAELLDENNIIFPDLEVAKEDSTSKTTLGKMFSFLKK